MEEEKKPSQRITKKDSGGGADDGNEDDDLVFPGFRFHPTDQELVGFYLKRKVEKKGFSFDIIRRSISTSMTLGSSKNSIRPNRVTGSGFWKATGIDKPIHDGAAEHIGLKKSLVYYRGSAGRGTKTDWMMHEFRLPSTELVEPHDAEIWTICRIFKRSTSYNRRCQQQQKQEHGSKRSHHHHQQLQYYYDYYRYHQHHYLHSSEAAYAATEHHQPFLLRGFHGSASSSAEMTTMTSSSGFMGVGLHCYRRHRHRLSGGAM
ncbi:unnamed protein product [Miscanthus lutarioriparius]|uniref:NAC domain-containing protein n=1 Tax=Miscanthus lutarioriparius TaxID=422564 RepID=A0A811R995_9POAL|nr:unnamed protein product [Miscanthus lutarioriparius]